MRITFLQRSLDPPGGGNAVAAWMLHALAARHEVTTVTEHPWSADRVDAFYGTSLAGMAIVQRTVTGAAAALTQLPGRLVRLRMALVMREARRLADDTDLAITADNYASFTRPGVQYLHFPQSLRPSPSRYAPAVHLYYRMCDAISGLSWDGARQNRTLVNSRWTAERLRSFGIAADVLYPPVRDPGTGLDWDVREDNVVCIGRFDPTKRLDVVVAIVDAVRQHHPLTLTLVGSPTDRAYAREIRRLAATRPWVLIREDLEQPELFDLLRRSRFGVHAMVDEHFGIAAAEMCRAGCVTFGHHSGGLIEVLDARAELLWDTPEDAVRLIVQVLRDAGRGRALSLHLGDHASRFSCDRFCVRVGEVVDAFVGARA